MAAEVIGGALLSSFLQVAFDMLASREFFDYFRSRRLDEALLKNFKTMLLSINAVIEDAEQKQVSNQSVKAWVDEVKDAMYEAEDILDEIDTELSRNKLEAELQSSPSKVRSLFSVSGSSFDKEIESRMKKVLENLEYLASQKDILRLKEGGGGAGLGRIVLERLPTTSLVDESATCGRDDDKEMIIEWLLSDNGKRLSVLSIVGMGGIGKSTLAQLVYNDRRVKDGFDIVAWVCVSEDFDVLRVTRTILEAITLSNDDTKDINLLQIKLLKMLTGKRFLLVLDDVWNENYLRWEALQTPFNYGALGSKILVTTRSYIVASIMRSTKIHPLKQLTEEDSWWLFSRYAFDNEDDLHSKSHFDATGRKIIKKCKGLPLALKTIGSLLYTKLSLDEWNNIMTSEIWKDESNMLPALRLSYHFLPSLLKRCFAYCSLFPKDYAFDKEELVQLWMAENFLPCPQHTKGKREVGDQFFHDLLSRSFFQRSSGDERRFVMHDLINDLAKDVSGEFCFRLEVEEAHNLSKMIRHFSYLRNSLETSKRFEALYKANKLRTFLPLCLYDLDERYCGMSNKMIQHVLSKFWRLRVLSLSGYLNIVELPSSIGNCKHLRYLDLSSTGVKRLPDSICLLYNLQTLKLRYCESLESLPSDLHKLTNLCYLDFRETKVREMPKQLGKLKNLLVLSPFYVGKCSETNIKQLGELSLQGTLSILELQNVVYPMDALAANLKDKAYLEELILGWSMNNDESENKRDVLEKLQPHQNLKRLSIRNYGGTRFAGWFAGDKLANLVSLELCNCRYCFFLPSLGLLPSLKFLSITRFDSIVAIGPELYGNRSYTTPFQSLEILRLQDMMGWEEWTFENVLGTFPRLREFYIKNCPRLKDHLPAQLPSLTKLVIKECEEFVASIPWAPTLHELILGNCGKLKLEYIPSTLKVLCISGCFTDCCLVERIEHTIANTCLEVLNVSGCANMEFPLHHCHNFLQRMWIESSCDSLRTFPLNLFPKLQSLELNGCSNLEMISVSQEDNHDHMSLTSLTITRCPKFVSFPKGGFLASKLEICNIKQLESLKSLPERMHILFPSLRKMAIYNCPQVESFPEGGLPSNLKSLTICKCSKLLASHMEWELHSHTSLQHLWIESADLESFSNAGLLPPALTSLSLYKCSNLKTLDYEGLCHLSSLKQLTLFDCPKLQCLPKGGLPYSLSTLEILRCPLLKERYQRHRGEDWEKIAHIPCIRIDNDIIT